MLKLLLYFNIPKIFVNCDLFQVIRQEDYIDKLKTENGELNDTNNKMARENHELRDARHQNELQITILQEKHRTCQAEVSH